jgi:hypothetical protein
MKKILVVMIAVLLVSCGTLRDQEKIQDGLLTLGLRQAAFLSEWGTPDKTYATTGQDIVSAGWNGSGGSFFKGKETFEVWVYDARKTELIFGRKKSLVGWKTNATTKELASPRK